MYKLICFDIDGTISHRKGPIHPSILNAISELYQQGWNIAFVTGAPYPWAEMLLSSLSIPYFLAPQNGVVLLNLEKKIIEKAYLTRDFLSLLQKICQGEQTNFIVYGGVEHQNQCFFCPHLFHEELRSYLVWRHKRVQENWIPLNSWDDLPLPELPSVKYFGTHQSLTEIKERLFLESSDIYFPLCHDSCKNDMFIAQATSIQATKGRSLHHIIKALQAKRSDCLIVTCGDDYNDITMFKESDLAVAMGYAPDEVKKNATIVTPPIEDEGILSILNDDILFRLAHTNWQKLEKSSRPSDPFPT